MFLWYFYSAECTITITNVSQVPIEMIEISVQSTLDSLTESKVFKWSDDNLVTQLPLQPQASASITLYMYAAMDFVVPQSHNGMYSTYPIKCIHSPSNHSPEIYVFQISLVPITVNQIA